MTVLIIKTNTLQISDVLIRDMGIIIPGGGGNETFNSDLDADNLDYIQKATTSADLRELTTDDAYGTDGSTLILNDGNVDIDEADVNIFLSELIPSNKNIILTSQDGEVLVNQDGNVLTSG